MWIYRLSRGRVANRAVGSMPILLLTAAGRRSGKRRTVPLCYMPDGEHLVVVGSRGGHIRHPDWALNLREHREATVEIGGATLEVRAAWTEGAERERLWEQVTTRYPFYGGYARAAEREIPVVRLTPVGVLSGEC